ncbi:hypothetical protein Hanom_Chr08g00722131 [Helianthus anomalus]
MKSYKEQQNKTNQKILREIEDIKKQKRPAEDQSPLMSRVLDFVTPTSTTQQSRESTIQPQGSFIHQQGSLAMTQSQGSFPRSEGYMEMFQPQGSYFHYQGSSARVQGSMDYPSKPSTQTFPGSSVFQDQGSSGRQPLRSSEIQL